MSVRDGLDVSVRDGEPAIVEKRAQGRLLSGPVVERLVQGGFLSTLGGEVDVHALELVGRAGGARSAKAVLTPKQLEGSRTPGSCYATAGS